MSTIKPVAETAQSLHNMMRRFSLRGMHLGYAFAVILSFVPVRAERYVERADWAPFFEEAKAMGTIVVSDERSGSRANLVFNGARAERRFSPASTFKIPHALFALDSGAVRDEFEIIKWDGKARAYPAWNRDQTLRSSMRHSVVWVYQKFANEIGEKKERTYLEKVGYGNQDPTGKDPFWVEGDLRITAIEQIAFLKKLYRNKLPFKVSHQRLVKDIMIVEAGRDWVLRAKTGWSGPNGWWVGWVEHPTGAVFFALNIETPNRLEDLPKREGVARAILASLNALKPREKADGR